MEYTLEPIIITKDLILNKVSEETLMEHYLGITPKKVYLGLLYVKILMLLARFTEIGKEI